MTTVTIFKNGYSMHTEGPNQSLAVNNWHDPTTRAAEYKLAVGWHVPLQNTYCEVRALTVTVLGDRAPRGQLRLNEVLQGSHLIGLVSLQEEEEGDIGIFLSLSPRVLRGDCVLARKRALTGNRSLRKLDLSFQPLDRSEIKMAVVWATCSMVFCHGRPNRLWGAMHSSNE